MASVAMTRFGPSIEPITFPTPSRYAICYAIDAGPKGIRIELFLQKVKKSGGGGGMVSLIGNKFKVKL